MYLNISYEQTFSQYLFSYLLLMLFKSFLLTTSTRTLFCLTSPSVNHALRSSFLSHEAINTETIKTKKTPPSKPFSKQGGFIKPSNILIQLLRYIQLNNTQINNLANLHVNIINNLINIRSSIISNNG